MADPISLRRPPAGHRYDPTAIDATGRTAGDQLVAVDDGSGGLRAGYATPGASSSTTTDDPYTAALRVDGDARVRESGLSGGTTDEQQVALLAQFYGA